MAYNIFIFHIYIYVFINSMQSFQIYCIIQILQQQINVFLFHFLNMLTKDTNVKRSLQAVYGSVGAIGFLLLVSLLILIVIAVHCYRVNKVVIVSDHE